MQGARLTANGTFGNKVLFALNWSKGLGRVGFLKRELAIGQGNESVADHCCNGK